MRRQLGLLRVALPLAMFVAGALALPVPAARAEDGPGGEPGAADLEAQIRQQMEKILRLMKENEEALLKASVGGGGKPAGVEVTPPEGGEKAATPPPGATPPPQGEEARRRMDEAVRATLEGGGTIPGELENLVKMIPT